MDEAVVTTTEGLVRGKQILFGGKIQCYCFLGIPYAKPPLGLLRFQAPQPPEPWLGILDVLEYKNDCAQLDSSEENCIGSEDCLYLNVCTPNIKVKQSVPVLVLINAFGFIKGSGRLEFCNPEYFLQENIVIVTFSFRIGPLGFLSASEPTAPGNVGLKDIIKVLRWIKLNIAQFGGDPENVTIFGSSGGGVIVNYLMLSRLSKDLFHRAIAQSGSILNPWAFNTEPLKTTFLLANTLGCKSSESCEVIEFLRTLPVEMLINSFKEMRKRNSGQYFVMPFLPSMENEYEGQEAFITKSPEQLLKSKDYLDVPLMTGYNRDEGFLFSIWENIINDSKEQIFNNIEKFAAWTLDLDNKSYTSGEIMKKFTSFYLSDSLSFNEYREKFMDILSDFLIIEGLNRFVKITATKNRKHPIYYFVFNYFGPFAYMSKSLRNEMKAVTHHEELPYLFKCDWCNFDEDTYESILVRQRMVKMWSNFIKYGDPTPIQDEILTIKWDPVKNETELNYLNIDKDLSMEKNPFGERMKFWESIRAEVKTPRGQKYFNGILNWKDVVANYC